MNRRGYVIYVVAFFAVLLVPLIGLAVPGSGDAASRAEKRDLAELPQLINNDDTVNVSYLGDLGAWFEDHFGFRDELITANSIVRKATVGSAVGDEVIIGRNGSLYYRGTEDDFLGRDMLSARELYCAAHNLRLMQDYAEQRGCRFLFVVAANKNSLYPQDMPYSYLQSDTSNIAELMPYLACAQIHSVDLHEALKGTDGLYFKRDTHWNGRGALIGYNAIMDGLETEHESYAQTGWTEREDHKGDLDEMLLPSAWEPEMEYYLDTHFTYSYDREPDSMRDPMIRTTCDVGNGVLYMFRDSFADALIPLMSQHFRQATYSMYKPWNVPDATEQIGTDVVVEIVERNLIDLVNRPAVLPAPVLEDVVFTAGTAAQIESHAVTDGPYVRISGRIGRDALPEKAHIAVRVTSGSEMTTYAPFYTSNEERLGNGFYLYLPADTLGTSFGVEIATGESFSDMRTVYAGELHVE